MAIVDKSADVESYVHTVLFSTCTADRLSMMDACPEFYRITILMINVF